MLNEDSGPSAGGLSSILGQFGLPSGGEFKLEKIAELSKTRAMASEVMFDSLGLEGQKDYLANHYITEKERVDQWAPHRFWEQPSQLQGFRFQSDSLRGFDRLENRALLKLHKLFRDDLSTSIDEITGILEFKITTTSELLSYHSLEGLFEKLSNYYTDKSVEKQQATFDALQFKCDSLEGLLNAKEYQLARIKDSYRSQWLNTEKVPEEKLFREIRMLTIMYGEALKNKELAAFSLDNMTPFIQAIDRPILPINRSKEQLWRAIIKGLIVGFVFGSVYVLGRKIYYDIMNED